MEYHQQHTSIPTSQPQPQQWSYGWGPPLGPTGPPPGPPGPPPAGPRSKRTQSESDDDAFSEESSKDAHSEGGRRAGDACALTSRKRRRGAIEKKRRDRINSSLAELKRLVPAAAEKQGSAKLEKAEILQLTVEHLKMIHAKGMDAMSYESTRYAMDYHSVGFRECAAEVARYLVSCEGLDIQDPLRLRLMSHLQCFAAQRELAARGGAAGWPQPPGEPVPPAAAAATPYYPAPAPHPPPAPHYPAPHYPPHPVQHQYAQNTSKPYRPWGTELAY